MRVRRRSCTGLALLFAALVVGAGCGDDDDSDAAPSTDPAAVTSDMLDGRTFVSTDVTGETMVDGTSLSLSFDGGMLSANAGCNAMGATYELDDGVLTVGEISQTLIGCADELQQQDEWVAALLEGEPTVTLDADVLTVSSDTTTVTLQES